jgi:broad specificity phosphatase PhoE
LTQFILVRHGATEWNETGRYQGQADPPLNEAGRRQAELLAEQLAGAPVQAVYSSDLRRACHTARAAAARLGLPVNVEPRLREVSQGAWEGMLHADILAQYPQEWAARQADPLHGRPPGGESVAEVAARALAAAGDIARAHPEGPVLIVSHGLTLAVLLCMARGLPLETARDHIPENATPIYIKWESG